MDLLLGEASTGRVPTDRTFRRYSLLLVLVALMFGAAACGDSDAGGTSDLAAGEEVSVVSDDDSDDGGESSSAGLAASDHSDGNFDTPDSEDTDPEQPSPPSTPDPTTPTTAPSTTTAAPTTTEAPTPECGAIVEEEFDPTSSQHVLPGAVEALYLTDPPTSGPHTAGPARNGVLDETLPRGEQIGVLEAGGVIIHHNGLDEESVQALLPLVETESVSLMPNDVLEPGQVVATAWLHKITCNGADPAGVQAFVDAQLNAYEEGH